MDQIIRAFQDTLRKTQFLPSDRLAEYQRGLLDRLVRFARAEVPFYRDSGRLDPLFRANDTIDWDRWEDIPFLTRHEVQLEGARLQPDQLPPEHGRAWPKKTSGSTGQPVTVMHSDLSGCFAWTSLLLRAFERNGIDPTRRMAHVGAFYHDKFDISGTRQNVAWTPEFRQLGLLGERWDLASTRPADFLVEMVAGLHPNYLQVMPANLQLMAAHDPQSRLAQLKLDGVISYGESFDPRAKTEIESWLGCPVFETYASNEVGLMATTCPHCRRFHTEAEAVRVEIIGDDGHAVASGGTGRVIVTPLYNYAMPLIRYISADVARRGADNGCRITLPALDEVLGRINAPFVFPGGIAIRPSLPFSILIGYLGARRFQVAQVAEDRCEMRIVPGSIAPADMKFEEVTQLIRKTWWDGIQIDYKIVDSLPDTPKPRPFVSELPERSAQTPSDSAGSDGPLS
jgi:phenylacetate-CoA ligase